MCRAAEYIMYLKQYFFGVFKRDIRVVKCKVFTFPWDNF